MELPQVIELIFILKFDLILNVDLILTGEFVSMGVFSDGSYGTPEGVMFSFPVTLADKKWTIVQGLKVDDFAKEKLALTGKELCEERDEAMSVCSA